MAASICAIFFQTGRSGKQGEIGASPAVPRPHVASSGAAPPSPASPRTSGSPARHPDTLKRRGISRESCGSQLRPGFRETDALETSNPTKVIIEKSTTHAAAIRHAVPKINNGLAIPSIHCVDNTSMPITMKESKDIIRPIPINVSRPRRTGDDALVSAGEFDHVILSLTESMNLRRATLQLRSEVSRPRNRLPIFSLVEDCGRT